MLLKNKILESFMRFKERVLETAAKIEAAEGDDLLSLKGKEIRLKPLRAALNAAIDEVKRSMASLTGEVRGEVASSIHDADREAAAVDFSKAAYYFGKVQAFDGDKRGFTHGWAEFKEAAEALDGSAIFGITDALTAKWPLLADMQKKLIGEVKAALLPGRYHALPMAKKRADRLFGLIDFVKDCAEHVELRQSEPATLRIILQSAAEAYARLHHADEEEPAMPGRKDLVTVLLEMEIPASPFQGAEVPAAGIVVGEEGAIKEE